MQRRLEALWLKRDRNSMTLAARAAASTCAWDLVDRVERDVVADGVVEEHDILAHEAHLRTQIRQAILADVDSVQKHRTLQHAS